MADSPTPTNVPTIIMMILVLLAFVVFIVIVSVFAVRTDKADKAWDPIIYSPGRTNNECDKSSQCPKGNLCIMKKCVPFDNLGNGSPCVSHYQCSSKHCKNKVCTSPSKPHSPMHLPPVHIPRK